MENPDTTQKILDDAMELAEIYGLNGVTVAKFQSRMLALLHRYADVFQDKLNKEG